MGLPAVQATGQPEPLSGDIVIMGYFETVDSGSLTKRIVLGFGSGSAHLNTAVEAYLHSLQSPLEAAEGFISLPVECSRGAKVLLSTAGQ